MAEAVIETALAELRPSFEGDGFDLSVGSMSDDGAVEIIFTAGPDACADCLVPDDVLIQILDSAIRNKGVEISGVTLTKVGFDNLDGHS